MTLGQHRRSLLCFRHVDLVERNQRRPRRKCIAERAQLVVNSRQRFLG